MKHFSHLNTAVRVLREYGGQQPFGIFIKDFFRSDKKFGSRDRKRITQLCYAYFRLGKALPQAAVEDRILLGLFLTINSSDPLLVEMRPQWNDHINASILDKLARVEPALTAEAIFPFFDKLSDGVDAEVFCFSHLIQPDLFLRIRPGRKKETLAKLQKAGIEAALIGDDCISLPNATKLDDILAINRDVVVQDLNSQRVAEFFPAEYSNAVIDVWDCCAASGGKSIMLRDWNPKTVLTVSDKRETIIINLRKRFREANIGKYEASVADLVTESVNNFHQYDLLIADLPCTGSGTWGRTPEQLYYFEKEKIVEYAGLQRKILQQISSHVKPGGYLLYITCSVFRAENESQIAWLQTEHKFELSKCELLKGYELKADTLFATLLRKAL